MLALRACEAARYALIPWRALGGWILLGRQSNASEASFVCFQFTSHSL